MNVLHIIFMILDPGQGRGEYAVTLPECALVLVTLCSEIELDASMKNMTRLDDLQFRASDVSSLGFPAASPALETFGLKFSSGGAHISRTMMMQELGAVLASVPQGSGAADYREAILQQNVLGKNTDATCNDALEFAALLSAKGLGMAESIESASKWFAGDRQDHAGVIYSRRGRGRGEGGSPEVAPVEGDYGTSARVDW